MDSGWWVAEVLHGAGPWALASWIFWVIFSITLHELGHGYAAIRVGDDTPIHLGRMTLNPLVHMGPTSLIVFAIIGIAWGAMPVNPSRFRGKHADALVAAAGPAVNVGLFVLCVVASGAITKYAILDPAVDAVGEHTTAMIERMEEMSEAELTEELMATIEDEAAFAQPSPAAVQANVFFGTGALLNAVLLVLNLLPVPPLDGSRILASFSGAYRRFAEGPSAGTISLILILFIFMAGAGMIWSAGSWLTAEAGALVAGLLP